MSYDVDTISIVNQLFKDIFAIKPAFKAQTQDELETIKRQWMLAFKENSINSVEQLKCGLRKMRKDPSPWFPSPGEFIASCKPDHNFMGWREAYNIAYKIMRQENVSDLSNEQLEIIKHAITQCTRFFLRNSPRNQTEPVFKYNYDISVSQFIDGQLTVIPNALTGTVDHNIAYQDYLDKRKTSGTYAFSFEQWNDNGRPLN